MGAHQSKHRDEDHVWLVHDLSESKKHKKLGPTRKRF